MDLGDITDVWTVSAFAFAAGSGFGFGFVVVSRWARHRRTERHPAVVGWITGAVAAWFVAVLVFSQTAAGLFDQDPSWPRIISRLGPYLVGAFATGLGTWAGLRWARRSKEGPKS